MSDEISTEKGRGGVMKKDELEEIYRLYYKDIYLYALSLARNRQDAEELASDAFYKALLSLETKSGSVKYWLFSVCRNLFLDQMRRRKRQPCEELSDKQTDDLEDTLAHLIREEEARKIYSCIQKLPDAYREMIFMFYFEEMSIAQIARLTGKGTASVKTGLFRARKKLKEWMEAEE